MNRHRFPASLALAAFLWPQIPPICVAAVQDHEREIVKGEPRRWLTDLSAVDSLAEKQGVRWISFRAFPL